MSAPHIWLRAETKANEQRRALSPANAGKLVEHGFRVSVERSTQSIFAGPEFEEHGCDPVAEGSWQDQAPEDAYILGLKELPPTPAKLRHRHIYFAHAYKGQSGWQDTLSRFTAGGGQLLDLEYLTDPDGRRIAAFGFWAGFAGAAVALRAWSAQKRGQALRDLIAHRHQQEMIEEVKHGLGDRRPRLIVIGANGRCGQGARAVAGELGLDVTCWDIDETRRGGPFPEILDHDILVNCVFVDREIPPFMTPDLLGRPGRTLSIICDVSCDPSSDFNPLPLYRDCTDFGSPCQRIADAPPLDLIAIDHLPSLLPAESSHDFSSQLLPALLDLQGDGTGVWHRASQSFLEKSQSI